MSAIELAVLPGITGRRQQTPWGPAGTSQSSFVHLQGAAAVPHEYSALEGACSGCGPRSPDSQA